MIEFHTVDPQGPNVPWIFDIPEFWICSWNNFKITLKSNIQEKL